MAAPKYIKHANTTDFEAMNARIYDRLGYNMIDPETDEKIGDKVKTYRYSTPIFHPSDGNDTCLMVMKPVTRWHEDGSFTKESPADITGLMRGDDLAAMKDRDEWHLEGFFPLSSDAGLFEKAKDKLRVWWGNRTRFG